MSVVSRKFAFIMVLVISVGGVFTYQATRPSQAQANPTCVSQAFEVDVVQGPDKGLALDGSLTLSLAPDGSLTGTFTPEKGAAVQVVGQATGRAINLVFDLGKDKTAAMKYIFGVGTAVNDLKTCDGRVGGMFVGPQNEDSGYWGGLVSRGK